MGLQCRPIKCADLHLPGSSRGSTLCEEGVGVHAAIMELPLYQGSLEKIPITVVRGIYPPVVILPGRAMNGAMGWL